MPAQTTVQFEK